MDCEIFGDGSSICGNFAELQDKKPEPLNPDQTAKWIEPYNMEWREVLGDAICNCTTVEVHYAPYYGFDFYHRKYCNLLRKLKKNPGIENLFEVHLPGMNQYRNAVKATKSRQIWVHKPSRSCKVKVRISPVKDIRQGVLL